MSLALKFLELTGTHGWKEFRAIQRVKQIRHAHLMPIVAIWLLDDEGRVISDDVIESIAASQQDSTGASRVAKTLVAESVDDSSRPAQLIVATLLANQTLGDRLKQCESEGRRGIPVDELLGYMDEAAKGLDFLNSSQHVIGKSLGAVQHCDVKPDNIMLTGGSVAISDFGVAQTLAEARQAAKATSLGGTPAYMAPEMFVNTPSRTSDQYSLAVTYYELRTGTLPFVEHTYSAVYQAHRDGTLDFSACRPAEQQVLRRATAVNPNERFASCGEFVDQLRSAVHPTESAGASGRNRTRGLAAAGLVGVVLAATIGYAVRHWPRHAPPSPVARIVIAVTPSDATVTIDGRPAKIGGDGMIVAERPIGSPFIVKASKTPDWLDGELDIDPVEGEQKHRLELKYSAAHFASESERLLDDEKFPEAVAALAQAIALEPDHYALLPAPTVSNAGTVAIDVMQLSDSGRFLMIGSHDGAVRRWAIKADAIGGPGEIVHRHEGLITALAGTDDWTASVSDDNEREILLTRDGGQTLPLTVPKDAETIRQIAATGDGRWLVAATENLGYDSPAPRAVAVYAWDLAAADGDNVAQLVFQNEGEFDPKLAAAHHHPWIALATDNGQSWLVRKCPVDGAGECRMICEQPGDFRAMVISPTDRWIAAGGGHSSQSAEADDFNATLIDAQSERYQVLRRGHQDSISAIAFDAAGNFLATGGADGNAQGWTIPDHWDAARPLEGEPVFLNKNLATVGGVACPRAGWVACNYQGAVALWDCQPGNPQWLPLTSSKDDVSAVVATPDGQWIITGHDDGTLRCWPVLKLRLLRRACDAAGEKPRPASATADQTTRCDRPFLRGGDSPGDSAGIACRPSHRPSAMHAG
jgi:hypothetical protein